MQQENFHKLMLITNKQNQSDDHYLDFVKTCVRAGVTSVQLREKTSDYKTLIPFAEKLRSLLRSLRIPLIINDYIDLAIAVDADGVHLGKFDTSPEVARRVLGESKKIGWSIESEDDIKASETLPIDYVGVGAIFPTHNKADVSKVWGIQEFQKLVQLSKHKIVAIGGINILNAEHVMNAGADGIAAIGIFHESENPEITTKTLRTIVDQKGKNLC